MDPERIPLSTSVTGVFEVWAEIRDPLGSLDSGDKDVAQLR
jgi:hypothetical protein